MNIDKFKSHSKSNTEISIIIPVFNEEDNILPLYRELKDVMVSLSRSYELVFIDDGSADKTYDVLDSISSQDESVKVIRLLRNFGQTAATMAGIDFATGEILVGMDGDGQNDPASIPAMIEKLDEGYDVVSGWRRRRKDKAVSRKLPSIVANWLISKISGVSLHDYGCSLKVYRRRYIENIQLYGEMHRFIPIYTKWMGGKITEIEVGHRARVSGKSKYGIGRVGKVLLDLTLVRFLDKFMTRPIHFFGGFGIVTFILSLITGMSAVYLKVFKGISFVITPLPLLTVLFFLTGLIFILMGILAEIIVRTYFESQNKAIYTIDIIRNL